jgi:hypothetical protein
VETLSIAPRSKSSIDIWYRLFWISSLVFYVISQPLVAFSVQNQHYFSLDALILGFLAVMFEPRIHWPWLANLALFAVWFWLVLRVAFLAAIFGAAAVFSALYVLAFPKVITNKGGVVTPIDSFGPGYWFWLASFICALAAGLALLKIDGWVPPAVREVRREK